MAWSSELLLAVLLGTVAGCGGSQPIPTPPLCPAPSDGVCDGLMCGNTNSPFTNVFPVNGVSASGTCNKNGIQLMPGTLSGGGCAPGSSLDIDPNERRLIGRPRGSGSPCKGAQLQGATFEVKSAHASLHLKIDKVEQFDDNGSHEGYLITYLTDPTDPTDPKGRSLCQFDVARAALQKLGFRKQDPDEERILPDGFQPEPRDDLVVALRGPVFDVRTGKPLGGINQPEFFNLACVGDALAKASFSNPAQNPNDTTVMLRLITANYCGQHMTVRGMKLEWLNLLAGKDGPVLEAEWGSDGAALCLGMPRLMTLRKDGKLFDPKLLPKSLQPAGCESGDHGTCESQEWIKMLQAQCGLKQPCSGIVGGPLPGQVSFTSQVGSNGKLHVEKVPSTPSSTSTSSP